MVYYDDERTRIRVDPSQGDRFCLINDQSGQYVPGRTRPYAPLSFYGATVRYGENTYRLRYDGWYHDGALVFPIQADTVPLERIPG